jgi:hypothetical protein
MLILRKGIEEEEKTNVYFRVKDMQKWQLVDVERFNRVLQHLNPFHQHQCQVVSMKKV